MIAPNKHEPELNCSTSEYLDSGRLLIFVFREAKFPAVLFHEMVCDVLTNLEQLCFTEVECFLMLIEIDK